jgi:RNA polymerase sigma-70 factor (ECF subfamily)
MERFADIVASAARGDESAFRGLWRAHQPRLLRYLRVVAGSDAEDIASETWLSAVRGLPRFSGDEAEFRAWLFTIARNRHIDLRRRERVRPVSDDRRLATAAMAERPGHSDTEADVLAALSTVDVLAVIARLPPAEADVVALRVVAELDISEVAAILGKREGAVRVCSHRGLRRLAELLAVDSSTVAV